MTLHHEVYTENDTDAKLRYFKTVVHKAIVKFNAVGTFHDRKRSDPPRKTTPWEDRSVRQIKMRSPKRSCKYICASVCLKGTSISYSTVLRCLSKE